MILFLNIWDNFKLTSNKCVLDFSVTTTRAILARPQVTPSTRTLALTVVATREAMTEEATGEEEVRDTTTTRGEVEGKILRYSGIYNFRTNN